MVEQWFCVGSGDLVSQDDVLNLLRPFCADLEVAVDVRLAVLQMLEQVSCYSQLSGNISVLTKSQNTHTSIVLWYVAVF